MSPSLSIYDSCTGTAGSDLSTHVSDSGATWAHNGALDGGATGSLILTAAGKVRASSTASSAAIDYLASVPPTSTTFEVIVDLVFASFATNGEFGIITNAQVGSSISYLFQLIQDPNATTGTWYIVKAGVAILTSVAVTGLANMKVKAHLAPGVQILSRSTDNGATWTQIISWNDSGTSIPASPGLAGIQLGSGSGGVGASGISDTVGVQADNFTVISNPGTWAPDSTGIILSPGNQNISAGVFTQWMHSATSLKCNFIGTSAVLAYDLTQWTAGVKPTPVFSIDGGVWNSSTGAFSGTSRTLASGLAYGIHTLELRMDVAAADESDTWTPADVLKITGLVLDSGGFVQTPTGNATARSKRMLWDGDSQSRGYAAQSITGALPSLQSVPVITAHGLDAELGVYAHSGQGWLKAATDGHTPNYVTGFTSYFNGAPRAIPSNLDYWVVCQGTNDGSSSKSAVASAVQSWLASARALVGSATIIIVVAPWNAAIFTSDSATMQSAILQGVTAYKAATPLDKNVVYVDISARHYGFTASGGQAGPFNQYSYDGLHPTTESHALIAADIMSLSQAAITSLSSSGSGGATSSVTDSAGSRVSASVQTVSDSAGARVAGMLPVKINRGVVHQYSIKGKKHV